MNLKSSYKDYTYQIDIKTHLKNKNIKYAFYFLDGQNAFSDKFATYHKSLKAKKVLNKLGKPYIAIAIYSPNDIARFSMYTPFILKDYNNDLTFYEAFKKDFSNIIIPTCEKGLKITKRFLISSSLACLTAITISEHFKAIALFSNAFFLDYESINNLIKPNETFNFIACGGHEFSDDKYNSNDYLESSQWYYYLLKKHHISAKLYIDLLGEHDEISWRKYLNLFIKHIKNNY